MSASNQSVSERFSWLTRGRALAGAFGIALVLVFIWPHSRLAVDLVIVTAIPGSLGASLWALTFWSNARVQIGRHKLRYKTVRRIAGAIALVGLPFLIVQRTSIYLRSPREVVSESAEAYPNMKLWRVRVVVAIAHLESDDGNRVETRLRDALGNFDPPLHITPIILNRTIPVSGRPQGIGHLEAIGSANDVGAYLLIWGGAKGVAGPAVGPLYETSFGSDPQFGGAYLPADFKLPELPLDDLCPVLRLMIANETAEAMARWHYKFGAALEPLIKQVRTIADDPRKTSNWTADTRARVNLVIGIAANTSGLELKSEDSFHTAIAYFQRTLGSWTREREPLEWAMAQQNFGFAQSYLADRNRQMASLEGAVAAYKNALAVYQSRSDGLDTARVQFELGGAYGKIGGYKASAEILRQSVDSYRAALKGFDAPIYAAGRADTQRRLGGSLGALADLDGPNSTNDLREAIAAAGEALKIYHKQSNPVSWAATQVQLAVNLGQLGAKTQNRDDLKQSIAIFQQVLDGYPRDRDPHDWATIQIELGDILLIQGDQYADSNSLQQAAIAYRAGLEELSPERDAIAWSNAKRGLGGALTDLGENMSNTLYLEQAVSALNDALKVLKPDREPLLWAAAKSGMGDALVGLGEQGAGVRHLKEAVDNYREALSVLSKDKTPAQWKAIQDSLNIALDDLHQRGWTGG